jgi:flagellar motor switch protein FliG
MRAMPAEIAPVEAANMTRLQKLAALLIILGPESASQLLKGFDEPELEVITAEMSKLAVISPEMQDEVLGEFSDLALDAGSGVPGGVAYAKKALEKTVGAFRASDIMNRVAPAPAVPAAMQQISDLDHRELCHLLSQERPQTVALVASYLPFEKCSRLLMLLPGYLRNQVVERLATLAPTPVEVVERIVAVLRQKAVGKPARAMNQTGGLKNAADVLKYIGRNLSQSVLVELEKRNPELGQAIRERMFTFEDLARLDSRSLQKIMREADLRDLAISLQTASESLRQALLASISRRAGEAVAEEISLLGPQRQRDIAAARQRILETARQLEAAEEIDLGTPTTFTRDELLV